jgi:hypothetical protein
MIGIAVIVQQHGRTILTFYCGEEAPKPGLIGKAQTPDDEVAYPRRPIPIRITEDELAAHAVMVSQLTRQIECIIARAARLRWKGWHYVSQDICLHN